MQPAEATILETPIAYLSAEFGFDPALPIYAGGLGILSGDTMKQAADENLPFVGVGLLYRGQYMRQTITPAGEQVEEQWQFDPVATGLEHVYVDGDQPLFISVQIATETVWLRCWKKTFSAQTILYLLDSDTDQNPPHLRKITQFLYAGDSDYQLKQEITHGIGAVQLLKALDIVPRLYHFNEGRPVFAHWQLILDVMENHQVAAESALRLVKNKVVYTNHTLVAAGNMNYPISVLAPLAEPYANKMGISISQLLSLGSSGNPDAYSVTTAALNVSHIASGVSKIHTELSKQLWPDYNWVNITNGVHRATWQDTEVKQSAAQPEKLWQRHLQLKNHLRDFAQASTGFGYDTNRLVVAWARRIAGYKQLGSLFADIEKLREICSQQGRQVQIVVSGKAHFGDSNGKELLKEVIHHFSTVLAGYALFIPNYNLEVAQFLTRGADIWLNTPIKGKEASGTSGMKAISNGVLQMTVQDGWTSEVDWEGLGWVLSSESLTESFQTNLKTAQDMYFSRNDQGFSNEWIARMQKSILTYEDFSTERMLAEYTEKLYNA